MNALRQPSLLVLAALISAGCNRGETSSAPATAPTTTTAPATMPTSATLQVGQQAITFAAPRAQFERDGDVVRLLIYSDKDDDTNSFYFEVPIDADASPNEAIDFAQELPRVQTEESPVGIELGQTILQPRKLRIVAAPADAGVLNVQISGEFVSDDNTQVIPVNGKFAAAIKQ